MFDSVIIKCPNCSEYVEFQSKAGDCTLSRYNLHDAPPAILGDLSNESQICKCGRVITIRTQIFSRYDVD